MARRFRCGRGSSCSIAQSSGEMNSCGQEARLHLRRVKTARAGIARHKRLPEHYNENGDEALEYVRLGSSGLKVSRIGLGMMSYGDPSLQTWALPEDEAEPLVRAAV